MLDVRQGLSIQEHRVFKDVFAVEPSYPNYCLALS